jgi:ADP-ribose pyrophosphatase YjhB (NUDIX family)
MWVHRLRSIAQTGLAFAPPVYDQERYQEILQLAAEMAATSDALDADSALSQALYERWRSEVGSGVPGYVTPKVGVGAFVFNDRDELLLVERTSHTWLFPTGWADIGYAPAEVVVKEVREETGLDVTPLMLAAVYDIRRLIENDLDQHLYSLVFYCRLDGGSLKIHPHETLNAGFFGNDALPAPLARPDLDWIGHAWSVHRGELRETYFDPPRNAWGNDQ